MILYRKAIRRAAEALKESCSFIDLLVWQTANMQEIASPSGPVITPTFLVTRNPVFPRRAFVLLTESGGKIFNAVKPGAEGHITYCQPCIAEQQGGMLQPYGQEVLMRRTGGKGFENTAEMKGAYITIGSYLH